MFGFFGTKGKRAHKGIKMKIEYEEFSKVEIRTGTVVRCELFPEARKPAYKVWVDFGDLIGVKQTSAQVTVNYTPESLIGRQVLGVVNLGVKKIAGFGSEFLLLGVEDSGGNIILASVEKEVPNGKQLH